MPKYKYHPACLIFPPISDDELKQLAQDIKERGLQNPIVTYQGQILDGRNRLAACRKARVKPRFKEWDGKGDPIHWTISENLHRRQSLTTGRAGGMRKPPRRGRLVQLNSWANVFDRFPKPADTCRWGDFEPPVTLVLSSVKFSPSTGVEGLCRWMTGRFISFDQHGAIHAGTAEPIGFSPAELVDYESI